MKAIFTSLALLFTASLVAQHVVHTYYMGTEEPDQHNFFVVVYMVDTNGTERYQGHGQHTLKVSPPSGVKGVYQMGEGSLVDFNDLSDKPEMQKALKDWEQSLALESFKKQSELNAEPFIYKNAAMEYVLKFQLPDELQLGSIECFAASGKNMGNFKAKPGSQPDEWIVSALSILPKGVYTLLVPTGSSEEGFKVVKFSIL